ncbi:SDR family oxidoreductase [Paraburkholderia youngii]|uniref:SDR family oxidoreductase n=1 Tax=Paraburkholderia youngii TaxID=2782701 RepID=UPI0035A14057
MRRLGPAFNAFDPRGRNGQPADVAEAILFMASLGASWITGTVLLGLCMMAEGQA